MLHVSVCFKCNFYIKAKGKAVKNFEAAQSSADNYPNPNSPGWEMPRVHLSSGSIILGGNCPSAII